MALLNVSLRLAVVLLGLGTLPPLPAATPLAVREVQAVFLLNLTRFIRWPESAFSAADAPLVIGCLDEPLAAVVTEAAKGETTGKHPIEVRRVRASADLEGCHLVYFGGEGLGNSAQMIGPLRARPVLTVSDADSFLRLGGQVQLVNRGGQMRLRLDHSNLQRAGLSASAQLLRVAEVTN
jgi:hypothetical protein